MHISTSEFALSLPFCWHAESLTFSCVGSFDLSMAFAFVLLGSGLNFRADFAKLWAMRRHRWSLRGSRLHLRHLELLRLPYFFGVHRLCQSIWVVTVEHNPSILHFHLQQERRNHQKGSCSFDRNSEYRCLILGSLQMFPIFLLLQRLAASRAFVPRIMTYWRSYQVSTVNAFRCNHPSW